MNKKEMLEVIQDKMGDKTLSEWCKVEYDGNIYTLWDIYEIREYVWEKFLYWKYDWRLDYHEQHKIIWHDVYLWDVLDYLYNKQTWLDWQDKEQYRIDLLVIMNLWEHKRKLISEQSIECITYIFNLIKE